MQKVRSAVLSAGAQSARAAPRALTQAPRSAFGSIASQRPLAAVAKSGPRFWGNPVAALNRCGAVDYPLCARGTDGAFGVQRAMSSLPPHVELTMPALSPTMTAGNIAKWMVAPGDKITPGDHLCDIETDKATIGWEAQEEGYVAKIFVEDGASDIAVGTPVLMVCDDEKDVAAFANASPSASAAAPAAAAAAAAAAPAPTPPPAATPPPPPPPPSSAPAPKVGGSVLEAVKGKKWAFAKEYGLKTAHHQYF